METPTLGPPLPPLFPPKFPPNPLLPKLMLGVFPPKFPPEFPPELPTKLGLVVVVGLCDGNGGNLEGLKVGWNEGNAVVENTDEGLEGVGVGENCEDEKIDDKE